MVNIVGLVLMIVSNAVSWHMVLVSSKSGESSSSLSSSALLRSAVWKIALFYCLWALVNRYLAGRTQELGHISMGLLTIACLATDHWKLSTKIPIVASTCLVVLNFAVVIPMIVAAGGPVGFAKKVLAGDASVLAMVWGYTFTVYMLSSVVLFSYVLYQFVVLAIQDDGGGGGVGSSSLSDPEAAYEALATADL